MARDGLRRALARGAFSMADHPWSGRGKALGPASCPCNQTRRFSRTAAAAWPMRRLILIERPGRMRALLIDCVGLACVSRHTGEMRGGENHPRRRHSTMRTIVRRAAFRHRPHLNERAANVAKIFIDGHRLVPWQFFRRRFEKVGKGDETRPAHARLSGDSGMSTPPVMNFVGPAAFGMMSKSKISVGR